MKLRQSLPLVQKSHKHGHKKTESLCSTGRKCDLRIPVNRCPNSHPGTLIKHAGRRYLREDLFHLTLPDDHPLFPLLRKGNQGRKVGKGFKTRTWPWARKQKAWRDTATRLILGSYSVTSFLGSHTHQYRDNISHSGLSPPTSISIQ